jgi:hypothetical protein
MIEPMTPREPTDEMIEAAARADPWVSYLFKDEIMAIWRAMHDAAPPPSPERIEEVARIIEPEAWRVLDSYLERTKRHNPDGGYDTAVYKHRDSMRRARLILGVKEGDK